MFVSDTHDAGVDSFYGQNPLHPARMPNFEELRNSVLANNPNIQSLRFSGIVPLPLQGDAKLDGLNLIGNAPATTAEQRINSEGFHNFSYLDLLQRIRGCGHACEGR